MLAGANGVGVNYATSYDAFFIVDATGTIRYRRTLAEGGPPSWRPQEMGPLVDQLLAELVVPVNETPDRGFTLAAAYPNPFNPSTTIPYRLEGAGQEVTVQLQIIDLRGRVIRTLVTDRQATGHDYQVTWDGRDNNGHVVSSGTYLSSLTVADQNQSRFLTLVK